MVYLPAFTIQNHEKFVPWMECLTDDDDESSGPPDPPAESSSVLSGSCKAIDEDWKKTKGPGCIDFVSWWTDYSERFCRKITDGDGLGWLGWLVGWLGWVGWVGWLGCLVFWCCFWSCWDIGSSSSHHEEGLWHWCNLVLDKASSTLLGSHQNLFSSEKATFFLKTLYTHLMPGKKEKRCYGPQIRRWVMVV